MGFSRLIVRIRSRTSFVTAGRPGCPLRTFQVQNSRKLFRCQAITVSGWTMTSAVRQSLHSPDSHAHKRRSAAVSLGRFTERCKTPIWWRRARTSTWSAARLRNEAKTAANNAEKTRAGENRRKRRNIPLYQPDPNLRERQVQQRHLGPALSWVAAGGMVDYQYLPLPSTRPTVDSSPLRGFGDSCAAASQRLSIPIRAVTLK
jgi:hypothetical protein